MPAAVPGNGFATEPVQAAAKAQRHLLAPGKNTGTTAACAKRLGIVDATNPGLLAGRQSRLPVTKAIARTPCQRHRCGAAATATAEYTALRTHHIP